MNGKHTMYTSWSKLILLTYNKYDDMSGGAFQNHPFFIPINHKTEMTLPRTLFNQSLYTRVRDIWLSGLPPTATTPTENLQLRWFPRDKETKDAFDHVCKEGLEEALNAIGPNSGHSIESLNKDIAEQVKVGPSLLICVD
jgi:hypothetical protein